MTHQIVQKEWGFEQIIVNCPLYCLKRLFLFAGRGTSWHYHNVKDETFYVIRGQLNLRYQDSERYLALRNRYSWRESEIYREACRRIILPGQSFHVPTGMIHRLCATEETELFEVSTQHFDEDSIRIITFPGSAV